MALTILGRRVGRSVRACARALGIARSTLWSWWNARHDPLRRLRAKRVGRPPKALSATDRETALLALTQLGPRTGAIRLSKLCPKAPRRALADLARRVRRVRHRRGAWLWHALRWRRAGAVWACDFTQPPVTLEGGCTVVFVVRDLASGKVLAATPMPGESAEGVVAVLEALFAQHGAPLVLKSDNGSTLVAAAVEELLGRQGILHLRSPIRTTRYNGACEAGIGSLCLLAASIAAAHGRGGLWNADDLWAARQLANAGGRAPCEARRSPDETWSARRPLGQPEREQLRALYRARESAERRRRGLPPGALEPDEQASIDRAAVGRALVEAGILVFRWRLIRPPLSTGVCPGVS